jgi:hypothetical protein
MQDINLFELRAHFNRSNILLCFNGPISRSLIEEIGNALKNYLQADQAQPNAAMDVFAVYIEMTQNIRHYALAHHYDEADSSATVVVARDDDNHYVVQAGNLVEKTDGQALMAHVNALANMDKAALKVAYKTQLRQPRSETAASGAGLGLIDIARKSVQPLSATLTTVDNGRSFFSVRAVIQKTSY